MNTPTEMKVIIKALKDRKKKKTGKTTSVNSSFQDLINLKNCESSAFPMHFNEMENVPCYKLQVSFNGVLIEDKDRRVSLWYPLFTLKSVQFQRQMHSAQSFQLKCRLLFSISKDSTKNSKESVITAYLQRHHRNSHSLETAKENKCYLNKHMCINICAYTYRAPPHPRYHIIKLYKKEKIPLLSLGHSLKSFVYQKTVELLLKLQYLAAEMVYFCWK